MAARRNSQNDGRQARRAQVVAARMCGILPAELDGEGDRGAVALARHLAIYLANRVYRMSHTHTAAMFGRGRDTAVYACRRIETLRADAKFDWQVFEVETLLRAAELVTRDRDAEIIR